MQRGAAPALLKTDSALSFSHNLQGQRVPPHQNSSHPTPAPLLRRPPSPPLLPRPLKTVRSWCSGRRLRMAEPFVSAQRPPLPLPLSSYNPRGLSAWPGAVPEQVSQRQSQGCCCHGHDGPQRNGPGAGRKAPDGGCPQDDGSRGRRAARRESLPVRDCCRERGTNGALGQRSGCCFGHGRKYRARKYRAARGRRNKLMHPASRLLPPTIPL